MRFTHYVALGDSMSTDEYPTCDLLQLDAVPGELLPAGAAALFYRNRDDLWPEFAGTDLATVCPGIEARVLAWDGAMIEDVLTEELSRVGRDTGGARPVITLTAGGNDLLDALAGEPRLARDPGGGGGGGGRRGVVPPGPPRPAETIPPLPPCSPPGCTTRRMAAACYP